MEYFEAHIALLYDVSMKEVSMVAGEHGVGVGEDLSDPVKVWADPQPAAS